MRRLFAFLAACAAAVFASSSQATIHPLMLGWICGNASGDPPGQRPVKRTLPSRPSALFKLRA